VVANLSLHSNQFESGQDMLRYSNLDKIMTLFIPPGNWKSWDLVRTFRHCLFLKEVAILAFRSVLKSNSSKVDEAAIVPMVHEAAIVPEGYVICYCYSYSCCHVMWHPHV